MDKQAQERFLDARQQYENAQKNWYGIAAAIYPVEKALASPENLRGQATGWNQMSVAGHPASSKPRHTTGYTGQIFDPSKWPTGQQIADAWIEINQAFHDFELAYNALAAEDRDYLKAMVPDSNER